MMEDDTKSQKMQTTKTTWRTSKNKNNNQHNKEEDIHKKEEDRRHHWRLIWAGFGCGEGLGGAVVGRFGL